MGDSLETIASTSAVVAPQVPPAKECSSPPEDKTETGACECGKRGFCDTRFERALTPALSQAILATTTP